MLILGIESSCDETGVALVDTERGLLADALHTQAAMHADYGGVVPELASRDHIRRVLPLTDQVLAQAACSKQQIDMIAYTAGPGLAGALLVGAAVAQGMAFAWNKPTYPIHHLEGHLLSPLLGEQKPNGPFVALLVSGGHTMLLHVKQVGSYELLGETVDDAAGEAFDKTAKLLGLGYPGGPLLAKLALQGNPKRFELPRPMINSGDASFSFSGLKTAVMTQLKKLPEPSLQDKADLAASTQAAIVEVLVRKSLHALRQTKTKQLVIAGGVGANLLLRERLNLEAAQRGYHVFYPPLALCTDNGAMIAWAAALRINAGLSPTPAPQGSTHGSDGGFTVHPRWPLA